MKKSDRQVKFHQDKNPPDAPKNIISITDFKLIYNKKIDAYYVRTGEVIACPSCGGVLKKNGWPLRVVIKSDGTKQKYKLQRYKCGDCGNSHRELPDFIVPYKSLERKVIEEIINGEPTEDGQENSTILKILAWWKALGRYIEWLDESVKQRLGVSILSGTKNLAQTSPRPCKFKSLEYSSIGYDARYIACYYHHIETDTARINTDYYP